MQEQLDAGRTVGEAAARQIMHLVAGTDGERALDQIDQRLLSGGAEAQQITAFRMNGEEVIDKAGTELGRAENRDIAILETGNHVPDEAVGLEHRIAAGLDDRAAVQETGPVAQDIVLITHDHPALACFFLPALAA